MRVVHVVRQFAPSVGGLEVVVSRLAREQQERLGHTVTVLTLDRLFTSLDLRLPREEVIDGLLVKRLAWGGSTRYPLCPQVIGQLGDADIVHVHAIDFIFDWLALTRWIHRKPMVASTHGGFFHTSFASTMKKLWFNNITRMSCTGYRRIIATSDNDGQVFRRIAGDRVAVVENGAETVRFRNVASPLPRRVLIYFGRWSVNKGLLNLLDVMSSLKARGEGWRLLIAGRPYDFLREDLVREIAARHLGDAVELHEAPSDSELRDLMAQATFFACLSKHEGFGIAAIEAMSAGLFPLLSDIPPFRKIVETSASGRLLSLSDPAENSAACIAGAVTEAASLSGRESRITFAQRYDWGYMADRYDQHYRSAIDTRPGSS